MSCAVTLGPVLRRVSYLVYFSAMTILKCLGIFEQEVLLSHLSLNPTHSVVDPVRKRKAEIAVVLPHIAFSSFNSSSLLLGFLVFREEVSEDSSLAAVAKVGLLSFPGFLESLAYVWKYPFLFISTQIRFHCCDFCFRGQGSYREKERLKQKKV